MNQSSKGPYLLPALLLLSTFLFSILGGYWNLRHYHNDTGFASTNLPFVAAMQGIHDKLYLPDPPAELAVVPTASFAVSELAAVSDSVEGLAVTPVSDAARGSAEIQELSTPEEPQTYAFTTAGDDYFYDACFIGDSRTVGIRDYCNMDQTTFLCKTSLTIFDYDKPKVTFNGKKTSVKEVLSQNQFAKIYLMVGINECGTGTPETFYENYRAVVESIRELQPQALIFIQGNLLITKSRSGESPYINNENISARNQLISTLANQRDIFYIDINESEFCSDGALIDSYTWDQVHVKAQYYPIWKDFLLQHAIITPAMAEAASQAQEAPQAEDIPQTEASPQPEDIPQTEASPQPEDIPQAETPQTQAPQ